MLFGRKIGYLDCYSSVPITMLLKRANPHLLILKLKQLATVRSRLNLTESTAQTQPCSTFSRRRRVFGNLLSILLKKDIGTKLWPYFKSKLELNSKKFM